MTSVGFFILSFRQILIYFFSFMDQVIWVLLLFLKVHILVYQKQFLLFPKNFAGLGIARQSMGKLGLDPPLGTIRAQTLAKYFFK